MCHEKLLNYLKLYVLYDQREASPYLNDNFCQSHGLFRLFLLDTENNVKKSPFLAQGLVKCGEVDESGFIVRRSFLFVYRVPGERDCGRRV